MLLHHVVDVFKLATMVIFGCFIPMHASQMSGKILQVTTAPRSPAMTMNTNVFVGKCTILWNNLPRAEQDFDFIMGTTIPYDQICR